VGSAPTLTIGVPVFNGAPYLEASVESILSQSFRDLEVIISDNASTDDTERIGRALAARDDRVTYRRNRENVGLSANFNLLVGLARGRLFKWAAADDILRPGYLERCVAAIDADPAVVWHTQPTKWMARGLHSTSMTPDGTSCDGPSVRLSAAIGKPFRERDPRVIRTDSLRNTTAGALRAATTGSCRSWRCWEARRIPDRLFVRRIHEGRQGNAENAVWMRRYWGGSGSGCASRTGDCAGTGGNRDAGPDSLTKGRPARSARA
jgi:glycosyltransferase involved in cell wall biosynthesis